MRLPSKAVLFPTLMVLSAISAFLLPPNWTAWIRGLVQPISLAQVPVSWGARAAGEALDRATSQPLSADRARMLLRENEELKLQVGQQKLRLDEAERLLSEVTGVRTQLEGAQTGIIVVPVVAYDVTPRRESLQILITEQQRRWVHRGQWVVAAGITIAEDAEDVTVRDFVERGSLIGVVSEVSTHVARVRLTTDPRFECEVRTAQPLDDGTWQAAPHSEACRLRGRGGGEMQIDQAVKDYLADGYRIVVAPASTTLPSPLSLGWVTAAQRRDDSPLHYDLTVRPWRSASRLRHVYIISMEP